MIHIHKQLYYNNSYHKLSYQNGGTREKLTDDILVINKNNKFSEFCNSSIKEEYEVKISVFKIIDETRDNEESTMLYLMSPSNIDIMKSCIVIRITSSSRIADLNNIYVHHKCTNQKDNPDNSGELFLSVILYYLRKNKTKFNIRKILLSDESEKTVFVSSSKCVFDLFYSRAIEGKKPYYMKFCFLPVNLSAYIKIHNNFLDKLEHFLCCFLFYSF